MFEYVASGLSHTRIKKIILRELYRKNNKDATIVAINSMLKSINQEHHKLSVLFNAYQEANVGRIFNEIYYKDSIEHIYSDSGGLQMLTLGHTSTDELKNKVYKVQSDLSHVGLCFDEMPVVLQDGQRSSTTNMSFRYYDSAILEQKARETGVNIRTQIEHFKSNSNNKCKVLLILQGNCFDTYQRWADILMEEIGIDNWQYVKGIASGGAALGQGTLEDFKRTFYSTKIALPSEIKIDHYHLLGVGSLHRMLPMLALRKNNTIDDSVLVSYDSTTHTGGISRGNYFMNDKMNIFPHYKGKAFYDTFNNINENLTKLKIPYQLNEDHLFARISKPSEWDKKFAGNAFAEFTTFYGYLISSVYNFMNSVDSLYKDDTFYDKYANEKNLYLPLNAYSQCRDMKDFVEWEKCFNQVLDTNKVNVVQKNSIDDFF